MASDYYYYFIETNFIDWMNKLAAVPWNRFAEKGRIIDYILAIKISGSMAAMLSIVISVMCARFRTRELNAKYAYANRTTLVPEQCC